MVKKGKSTAAGDDGITYHVITCLAGIRGGTLSNLFSMSYIGGYIPHKWKTAVILPVPKGTWDFH